MKLHSKIYGDQGPHLIVIHGLFGMSDNWNTLGKQFAKYCKVHLIDLRNHGRSPHSLDFNYEVMSEDLYDYMEDHNIVKANNEINNNVWQREENRGIELENKTVGIIGYGKTGKNFAKKLAGFNVKVLCNDIIENIGDDYAEQVSIDEIQSKCDIISLHTDLNKLSKHLVNTQFIDNCKKPFYLINTSRGLCVKTSDLILGIKTGKILGACLDVIENESSSFEK